MRNLILRSHLGNGFLIDKKGEKNILLCIPSVSTRIRVHSVGFLVDTAAFPPVSGRKLTSSCVIPATEKISKRTVPGTVCFQPEYCFHVSCIFQAGSDLLWQGNGGNSRKKAPISVVSCRIQWLESSTWDQKL
jgi:hypothetical protein